MRMRHCRFALAGAAVAAALTGCGNTKHLPASAALESTAQAAESENADLTQKAQAETPSAEPTLPVADSGFSSFLRSFRIEALNAGISPDIYEDALRGAAPDPRVMEANARQPEFVKPIWDYLAGAVSQTRVDKARVLLATHSAIYDRIEAFYGVDREIVTAIWGLESNFGDYKGSFHVPTSLATLAYQGRRQKFGRSQLLAALKILEARDIQPKDMLGSWAGAMGHTQFIPTSYLAYAVDADGDGRRNIWTSIPDALSSTANYLDRAGWQRDLSWGVEVKLPAQFDYALADDSLRKPVSTWTAMGIKAADGSGLPIAPAEMARLILPAGYRGPAFLVTRNFDTIMAYNNATSYALAVGYLASRMRGGPEIQAPWPTSDLPLTRDERHELQARLNARGFDAGPVDGIIGMNTREALRAFQRAKGLPADGYPTKPLLEKLRQAE